MSRIQSLLKKAEQLLDGQWDSFSALDRWIQEERSVPATIREEWKRVYQLQEFFRREHFQKLIDEVASSEESREALKALRFVRDTLKTLDDAPVSIQGFMEHLTQELKADRGILLTCSEESGQVRVVAASKLREPNLTLEEYQISRTVFREVLRSGQGVLIRNALEDRKYAGQTSILGAQIQSVLAVPIAGQKKVIGILYFDSCHLDRGFSESDRTCLEQVLPLITSLFFARSAEEQLPLKAEEVFLDEERALHGLIGRDPNFLASLALLKKVARTPAPVLLTGESGTGKELFARAIHALSAKKDGPFVAINCAAIPDTLLESELFGHEKGAFTGADSRMLGRFERAARGTLFLDEIGEMKLELQAKLLRFLQSNEIERVGGGTPIRLDVRIIAATNQDLDRRVAGGSFRQDLYYRLNVFHIPLPSLRKRKGDIRLLADHFFRKYASILDLRSMEIETEVYTDLENYEYPGNIRELENIVYRSLLLAEKGKVTVDCLAPEIRQSAQQDLQKNPFWHLLKTVPATYDELSSRKEQMKEICRKEIAYLERRFAESLVAAAGGNVSKAAQLAGVDRGQFHRLLKSGD